MSKGTSDLFESPVEPETKAKKETKVATEDKQKNELEPDTKTKEISTPDNEPKMGVDRFLQLYPQDFMIECLLRDQYGQEIMTESEWLKTLDDLLNTKITD